jgi:hypothetical protein
MVAAVLVAGALTLGIIRATRSNRERAPGAFEYTQLTNFTDAAFLPTLSPDGRMLAFIRGTPGTVGGKGDIVVKLLPDGEAVRLTHDGRSKMYPVFTPGGDLVSYAYSSLMTDPKAGRPGRCRCSAACLRMCSRMLLDCNDEI